MGLEREHLTGAEIIAILDDFEIQHHPALYDETGENYGLCVPRDRIILLSKRANIVTRYQTIIHEMLHARDFIRNSKTSERDMNRRTNQVYHDLFHNGTNPLYGK